MSDDLLARAHQEVAYFKDGGHPTAAALILEVIARCERAEADADRLVRCLFLLQASDDMSEHALRLHDEAKALR